MNESVGQGGRYDFMRQEEKSTPPLTRGGGHGKISIDRLLDVALTIMLTVIAAGAVVWVTIDTIPVNKYSKAFLIENVLPSNISQQIVEASEGLGQWQTQRHANYPTTDIPLSALTNSLVHLSNGSSLSLRHFLTHDLLEGHIFPLFRELYSDQISPTDRLWAADLFIAKYSADGQRALAPHTDSSMFSFNIALSQPLSEDLCAAQKEPSSVASVERNRTTTRCESDSNSYGFCGGGTSFSLLSSTPLQPWQDAYSSLTGEPVKSETSIDPRTILKGPQGAMLVHPSRLTHAGVPVTCGARYVLVGFIEHRVSSWKWLRRFGRFSQCLQAHRLADSQLGAVQKAMISDEMRCQSLSTLYADFFIGFYRDLYFPSASDPGRFADSSSVSIRSLARLGRQFSVFALTISGLFCIVALIMLAFESISLRIRKHLWKRPSVSSTLIGSKCKEH